MTPTNIKSWSDLLGKRVLLTTPGNITRYEVEVVEVSPSGDFVKLRWSAGTQSWSDRHKYQLLEVLEPQPSPDRRQLSQVTAGMAAGNAVARALAPTVDWSELLKCGADIELVDGALYSCDGVLFSERLAHLAEHYDSDSPVGRAFRQLARYFSRKAAEGKPPEPTDAEAEKLVSEFEDAVRSLPGITSLGGGSTAARTALLSYIAGLRRQIALLEGSRP